MTPPIEDVLGALLSAWFFLAVGAVTTQTALNLWRLSPPRKLLSLAVVGLGLLYLGLYLSDVLSVLQILQDDVVDIPPTSSWRTGSFSLLLSLVWLALWLLAPHRRKP